MMYKENKLQWEASPSGYNCFRFSWRELLCCPGESVFVVWAASVQRSRKCSGMLTGKKKKKAEERCWTADIFTSSHKKRVTAMKKKRKIKLTPSETSNKTPPSPHSMLLQQSPRFVDAFRGSLKSSSERSNTSSRHSVCVCVSVCVCIKSQMKHFTLVERTAEPPLAPLHTPWLGSKMSIMLKILIEFPPPL